jgi:hypothetical protein
MLVSHKILPRLIRATKKPRLTRRQGDKTVVLVSFFPKPMMLELELAPVTETKSSRLPWCLRASPSTTLDESVQSTDADKLIFEGYSVKWILYAANN